METFEFGGAGPDDREHSAAQPDRWVTEALARGLVIPAHPLALNSDGEFDRPSMRALTRYYHACGAGGLAVAVHTTQFEIRAHGLLDAVLESVAETARECDQQCGRATVLISGVCGPTGQAVSEAQAARNLGYHAALVSLADLPDASEDELIRHCREISQVIPLVGFYLQPAVGGRILASSFWQRFCEIPNVVAIKIAPFDRYRTLDVLRGVASSARCREVALYTGNDDNILLDLLTNHSISVDGRTVELRMVGGLLGHWACWTHVAVELLSKCHQAVAKGVISQELLTLAAQVTESNAALFDATNGFAGCIAGVQEVLCRQGLLSSARLLDPRQGLSDGQGDQIDRVTRGYPHLTDDDFVRSGLTEWKR